jgi:hypothetical protein
MSKKIDPTSGAIAAVSAVLGLGLFIKRAKGEEPTDAHLLALSGSLLGLVAYDRWYDGMWPFEDKARLTAARTNPP